MWFFNFFICCSNCPTLSICGTTVISCRMATKTCTIRTFVWMTILLLSTLESITTLCFVRVSGIADLGRFIRDVVTNCDEMEFYSSNVSWNIKSLGKCSMIFKALSIESDCFWSVILLGVIIIVVGGNRILVFSHFLYFHFYTFCHFAVCPVGLLIQLSAF